MYYILAGLRGDKWHIGCYRTVRKSGDNSEEWLAQNDIHVAVLDDDSPKTANTVIGIVRKSLEHFRLGHPEIREIELRFDNAGCYHAKLTVNALHSLRSEFARKNLKIAAINYNEPGKKAKLYLWWLLSIHLLFSEYVSVFRRWQIEM